MERVYVAIGSRKTGSKMVYQYPPNRTVQQVGPTHMVAPDNNNNKQQQQLVSTCSPVKLPDHLLIWCPSVSYSDTEDKTSHH